MPEVFGITLDRQEAIGIEEVRKAQGILRDYKDGKTNLEDRVIKDEQWWKLRHWQVMKGEKKVTPKATDPEPTSAWLFNSILNKHADAMDNYPEPAVLPRERSDEESAKLLSSVLPVIMEYNDFEQTYSDNWWDKLKHGTAAYGVFWNNDKENGLGDIDIREIDLLKLFWEPGIADIQDSRNVFIVELVDNDLLKQQYPQLEDKGKPGNSFDVAEYVYDDQVDTSDKSAVVDWYYKIKGPAGKTVLHYAKFVGDTLLYASENDPEYAERGWYDHGLYPVVLDCLFPEKGTPIGFGYVAICKDPQLYIDKLSGYVLENAMMTTKKRFFVSSATNINREQFLDWNQPIVDVEGELSDNRVKEINVQNLDSNALNVLQMKIEEMKDTAANRDVNSGGTGAGITAASAIAALQEAGNKASRDMISTSYRAYSKISALCIELIRQFYDEARCFRVAAPNGAYDFVDVSNAAIKEQQVATPFGYMVRKPIFDLKISAQKKNPFSRMEQNERAKELYAAGFFNPERAQECLGALEMMDFEGIEKVKEYAQQGATLLNICQQQQQQIAQLTALLTGQLPQASQSASGGTSHAGGQNTGAAMNVPENRFANSLMQANTPMTDYGQRLAKRSVPSLENVPAGATPR
jgi:hypothetical protein